MPRHIEQPAPRQSKPAARKTSSRPSASACALTCWEPGTTIALTRRGDLAALDDLGGGAQVADARVRARADEDAVERDLLDRRARPRRSMYGERALVALAARLGHRAGDARRPCPGFVPHVTCGESAPASTTISRVERRAVVGAQRAPVRDGLVEVALGAPGRPSTHANVVSSGAIMPARPPPSIVMLQIGHAALHRERLDRRAGVLDDVADGAVDAHLADRAEDQVLGRDAEAELALVADPHRLRLAAGRGTASPARARPRSCRSRTRARRRRRAWPCASRRRRSSCPAA